MDPLRAAEIYASRGKAHKYGSGYLIAPGCVLTAWHVVDIAPAGGSCELRLLGDVIQGRADWGGWDVVWHDAKLDLALLRAQAGSRPYGGGPSAALRMARLARSQERPACMAVGFPRVMRHGDRIQSQEVSGVVLTKSLLEENRWQVVITTGAAPRNDEDWKGVSGAALFCAGRLVGVITDAETRFRQGVLVAQPIDPLPDAPAFLEALGLARDAAFDPADAFGAGHDPRPWHALYGLAYLVDRNIPVEELKAAVARTLGAKDAPRTLVCAVPGDVEHEHIDLIELFRKETLPALFPGRRGFDSILPMDWAGSAGSVRQGLQQLRLQVHGMLGIVDAGPDDSAQRIAGALNGDVTPRAFSWEIRESEFTVLQRDLLQAWLAEWAKVASAGLNDVVTLFFCLVFDRGPAPARPAPAWKFWAPKPPPSLRAFACEQFDIPDEMRDRGRLHCVRLSDLAPCERRKHLKEWGAKLEARPRDSWLAEHVSALEMKVEQDLFPLRTLLQTLNRLRAPPAAQS